MPISFSRLRVASFAVRAAILLLPGAIHGQAAPVHASRGDEFDSLVTLIERKHLRPALPDSLLAAARRAMVQTLDPYSRYLDRPAWSELQDMLSGTMPSGVGVELRADSVSGTIVISALVNHSPAVAAGLQVHDILIAVDGRPVTGWSLDDALRALRGASGTSVALTLRRGTAEYSRVAVRRASPTPTVRGLRRASSGGWDYMADTAAHIAYVRIEHFAATTPLELDSALAAVARARATALVLDLRVNPGGLVASAIDVADRFLDNGTIFTFQFRDSLHVFDAHRGTATDMPVVLLVDGYTQSVAELVAASLQDRGRATVAGTRTWGKAHGQELFALGDGTEGVRLTTFAFQRPSGRPMERHYAVADTSLGGVWPDSALDVPLATEEYQRWVDAFVDIDGRMSYVGAQGATSIDPADRVLDRAIVFLRDRAQR